MKNSLNTPVATQVAIIGELTPGSVIRATYIYNANGGSPEKDTECRWIINGVTYAGTTDLDLQLNYSVLYSSLRVSITPKSEAGEKGIEAFSPEYTMSSGFQNISNEESENSFIKQHGCFSIYNDESRDRILITNSAAFTVLNGRTQSLVAKGRSDHGGAPPADIVSYLQNNPAIKMFSTASDFAAQVPVVGSTTRILVWGRNTNAVDPGVDLNNIKYVYSNSGAFAFIYDNPPPGRNTIGAIGNAAQGGVIPEDIQRALLFDKPVAISATESAFAVRTQAGQVYCWGAKDNGGFVSPQTRIQLDRLHATKIICTARAFCVIGPEKFGNPDALSIVTIGNVSSGGTLNPSDLESILDEGGVKTVIANRDAFCAITKRRGKALSWGASSTGGTMSDAARTLSARGGIAMCVGSAYAFCMVNIHGDAEAWGQSSMGGTTPTTETADDHIVDAGELLNASGLKLKLPGIFKEFKVDELHQLTSERKYNNCRCGIELSSSSKLITTTGAITLRANDTSFFLYSQNADGTTNDMFTWGNNGYGGSMPSAVRQVLMASKIKSSYSTNGAFGVISTQGATEGAVSVFGGTNAQNEAGEIPAELRDSLTSDVLQLYSVKKLPPITPSSTRLTAAFAARRTDGRYVVWGAKTDFVNEIIPY